MDRDGVYKPDRTIRDVYESGTYQHNFAEMGLSPYARIGSLAGNMPERHHKWLKPQINQHSFTFVGPLVGPTLSPSDRQVYNMLLRFKSLSEVPLIVIASISLVSRIARSSYGPAQGRRRLVLGTELAIAYKDRVTEKVLPVLLMIVAVLLVIYAYIITPMQIKQPTGNRTNGTSLTNTYNGQVVYNAMFPLIPEHAAKSSVNMADEKAVTAVKPNIISIIKNTAITPNPGQASSTIKQTLQNITSPSFIANNIVSTSQTANATVSNVVGSIATTANIPSNTLSTIKPSPGYSSNLVTTQNKVTISVTLPISSAPSTKASIVKPILKPVMSVTQTTISVAGNIVHQAASTLAAAAKLDGSLLNKVVDTAGTLSTGSSSLTVPGSQLITSPASTSIQSVTSKASAVLPPNSLVSNIKPIAPVSVMPTSSGSNSINTNPDLTKSAASIQTSQTSVSSLPKPTADPLTARQSVSCNPSASLPTPLKPVIAPNNGIIPTVTSDTETSGSLLP